jgi:hypothetical protein
MAFTFVAYARIALSTPVSTAALRKYLRAVRTLARLMLHSKQTGKWVPESRITLALRRQRQAEQRAYPLRRGTQVTTTTVTFSAIGQPQHITAPPDAVSYRKAARMTTQLSRSSQFRRLPEPHHRRITNPAHQQPTSGGLTWAKDIFAGRRSGRFRHVLGMIKLDADRCRTSTQPHSVASPVTVAGGGRSPGGGQCRGHGPRGLPGCAR